MNLETTDFGTGDKKAVETAKLFREWNKAGKIRAGRSYRYDPLRRGFVEDGTAPRGSRLKESPKIILALAELKRLNRKTEGVETPKSIVRRLNARYGKPQQTVEPLSDQELGWYSNPYVKKPHNFEERLRERNRRRDLAVTAESAALHKRVADAREKFEDRLYGFRRWLSLQSER